MEGHVKTAKNGLDSGARMSRRELLAMLWPLSKSVPYSDGEPCSADQDVSPCGKVEVEGSKCSGCGLCTVNCPTMALAVWTGGEEDSYQLLFRQDACVACGRCRESCPEKCLQVERVPQGESIGRSATILFSDRVSRCKGCGIPLPPQAMIKNVKARISPPEGPDMELDRCPSCRVRMEFERGTFPSAQ